jgi:hypothetical protein
MIRPIVRAAIPTSLLVFLSSASVACGGATAPDLAGGSDAAGGDSSSSDGGSSGDASALHDVGVPRDAALDVATFDASATFPCGKLLVCHSHTEACKIGYGGPANTPPRYECIPYPSQCASDRTCGCVQPATSAQACKDTAGDFTVEFFYP